MRMLTTNYFDSEYATVVSSYTYAGGEIQNARDPRLDVKWIIASTTAQSAIIDFGAYGTTYGSYPGIGAAAILGHNLWGVTGTTFTIEGNTSNSWPGLTSYTITYNAENMLTFFNSDVQLRYWRFSFYGTSGFSANPMAEIGRLWLGPYTTIDSSLVDLKVIKRRTDNVIHGRGHQKFSTEGVPYREFNLNFPSASNTAITAINTLYNEVGNHQSFIFCNFDTLRGFPLVEPCYVSIADEISFQGEENLKFKYSMKLVEEL